MALLRSHEPTRLLLLFTVTGFVVSLAVGLLVVEAFGETTRDVGPSTAAAVFELLVGVAAVVQAVAQVAAYNALWFIVPLAGLGLAAMRPDVTQRCLARATAWASRNQRALLVVALAVFGSYLTIKGAVQLL